MRARPGGRPVPPERPAGQPGRAAARARLRLALSVLGLLGLTVLLGPVAVLVRRQWQPLVDIDQSVTQAAERAVGASPALLDFFLVTTHLGDPLLMTALTVLTLLLLLRGGQRRLALFVLVARLGSLVLSQGTKNVVDRARPVFDHPVASAAGASFPSGHALGSTVFYTSTALVLLPLVPRAWRPALLVTALTVPLVVSASRVMIGVHYLSDVTAGFLLGLAWVAVCTAVFATWRAEEGRPVEPLTEGLEPELAE
ncbi:MAG: hypothetical protein JWN57_64 [Frankiales bacterium]|nr:hypothetical protein [Frankiales bacterium]